MLTPNLPPVSLVVLRLEDVCVRIQDEMEGFLRTAGLIKMPEVETTVRWLRKRGCKVGLISQFGGADFRTLLQRLNWSVGPDQLIQYAVEQQSERTDPLDDLLVQAGRPDARRVCTVFDTPSLIRLADRHAVGFNLGVTNGSSTFSELSQTPVHFLLDQLVQLPNYLVSHAAPEDDGPKIKYFASRRGFLRLA